jgi:hypothetical protein
MDAARATRPSRGGVVLLGVAWYAALVRGASRPSVWAAPSSGLRAGVEASRRGVACRRHARPLAAPPGSAATTQVAVSQFTFWHTPTPLPASAPPEVFAEARARAHTRALVGTLGRQVRRPRGPAARIARGGRRGRNTKTGTPMARPPDTSVPPKASACARTLFSQRSKALRWKRNQVSLPGLDAAHHQILRHGRKLASEAARRGDVDVQVPRAAPLWRPQHHRHTLTSARFAACTRGRAPLRPCPLSLVHPPPPMPGRHRIPRRRL